MKRILLSLALVAGFTTMNAQITVFEDSFEDYEDFTIANFGGWIQHDEDGGTTWGITELGDFPNVNYIGAGMIFNASAIGADESSYGGTTGDKALVFFASGASGSAPQNDDWTVSPLISLAEVSNARLSLNAKNQENLLWEDLKKFHTDAEWPSGIYDKRKCIEVEFKLSDNKGSVFFYMLYDGYYHCRVKVLEDFPEELTTECFILAAHFNNLLNNGVVVVNVDNQFVEYHLKSKILVPLLYNENILDQLILHNNTSLDIHWAFQRLVKEGEEPVIIIADLMKMGKKEKDNEE